MPPAEPAASDEPGQQDPSPRYWLFKEEPETYSFERLQAEGRTLWDGVENALARKYLRQTRKGDRAFFYETGKRKSIVGLMELISGPVDDPSAEDGKGVAVRVKPIRALKRPVSLAEIKADPAFAHWELVRMSRLSVMGVEPALVQRIESLAQSKPSGLGTSRPQSR